MTACEDLFALNKPWLPVGRSPKGQSLGLCYGLHSEVSDADHHPSCFALRALRLSPHSLATRAGWMERQSHAREADLAARRAESAKEATQARAVWLNDARVSGSGRRRGTMSGVTTSSWIAPMTAKHSASSRCSTSTPSESLAIHVKRKLNGHDVLRIPSQRFQGFVA